MCKCCGATTRKPSRTLEAGIPKENESTSPVVHFLAFSGKTLALLYSGRLGELVQLLRAGREIAEKNGNEPWLFVFREAWLRTTVLDFAGARQLCEAMVARSADAYWRGQSQHHRRDRHRVRRSGAGEIRRRVAELRTSARPEENAPSSSSIGTGE